MYLHNFFWNFEIRILAVNPYSISKSYAYVAETPTRVCLTFCSSGNLLAFKTLMSPIKIKPQNIWRKKKQKPPFVKGSAGHVKHVQNFRVLTLKNGVDIGIWSNLGFYAWTSLYRGCLCEENCRGGTEVSVKITCDEQEKRLLGKALMWPLWKEKIGFKRKKTSEKRRKKKEEGEGRKESNQGGRDHDLTISVRRTHHG